MSAGLLLPFLLSLALSALVPGFRPPAVPLVVNDPYISIWSFSDKLTDSWSTHWSGSVMALAGLILIDGKGYRFMGPSPMTPNAMDQLSVQVFPTQTVYDFETAGVHLTVTFTTPSALDSTTTNSFSDPVSYITFTVSSSDGQPHSVKLYYDNTAEVCTNDNNAQVEWQYINGISGQTAMRIGSANQNPLSSTGDGVKISWGWWYVSTDTVSGLITTMASSDDTRPAFLNNQPLPGVDNRQPRAVDDGWPALVATWDFGSVNTTTVSRHLTIVFDDLGSIKYFNDNFLAAWTQRYAGINAFITASTANYAKALSASTTFDNNLMTRLSVYGDKYCTLGALVYRQVTGGTKLVWNDHTGAYWLFMKEISSCGCIQTVDVIYPAAPMFLVLNPESLRQLLLPQLAYANNETAMYGLNIPYNLAWAPHHLGQYPVCNLPPDQQEQMPMEETGNFFIMMAAIAQLQNDVSYIKPYWDLLNGWFLYLNSSLPDPEDQLCTDDFEGPSPHNVNLAAKGIVGLGAYSILLRLQGDSNGADSALSQAKVFAQDWLTMANDGDHYRLQYDLPGTWSTKYNLLFQKVLGLEIFPQSVFDMELSYYTQQQLNTYGVPLDIRNTFTKSDWEMWTAAMGTADQFNIFVNALYSFANTTPSRVPFTDWYDTISDKQNGFQARPVMGGLFSRLMLP